MKYEAKISYALNMPLLDCYCIYCEDAYNKILDKLDPNNWHFRSFIMCPDCGCKRCPKATYHNHTCSKSNLSGRHLSVYGDFKLDGH